MLRRQMFTRKDRCQVDKQIKQGNEYSFITTSLRIRLTVRIASKRSTIFYHSTTSISKIPITYHIVWCRSIDIQLIVPNIVIFIVRTLHVYNTLRNKSTCCLCVMCCRHQCFLNGFFHGCTIQFQRLIQYNNQYQHHLAVMNFLLLIMLMVTILVKVHRVALFN